MGQVGRARADQAAALGVVARWSVAGGSASENGRQQLRHASLVTGRLDAGDNGDNSASPG
jgi:hypothetical protein